MCGICECACAGVCGVCAAAIFVAVFYFFFGLIFIVLASQAKSAVSLYSFGYDVSLFPNLCIVIGILFTLLTFMGFFGQQKGRKSRIVYTVAQVAVLVLGCYIYIDAYPNEKLLDKNLLTGLNSSIHDYGLDVMAGSKSVTDEWDTMQERLECCGVNNYLDWEHIRPHGVESPPTPISCCKEEHRMVGCSIFVRFDHPQDANRIINVQGCLSQVRQELLGSMQILHWFLIPILIMVCLGILIGCCSSGVKKDTEMKTKQVGPIIVKVKARVKKEPTSYDVEAAEKNNLDDDQENKTQKEVEMQKLNPDGTAEK